MNKRIGIATAALAATASMIGFAPAHADTTPAPTPVIKQLTTHCVNGHCRQREVLRVPGLLGNGTSVYWRHRDWSPLPTYNTYMRWSAWQVHRLEL